MSTKGKTRNARKVLEDMVGPLTFGRLLESVRQSDELSQLEMAKKLGVSSSHLCDIIKGRKVVSPERAAKFARTLGYYETQFVRLSLQDLIDQSGLKLHVDVKAA